MYKVAIFFYMSFDRYMHSFRLDIYPGMEFELLSLEIYAFRKYIVLVNAIKQFSNTVVPSYTPTGNAWKFQLLHILANTWYDQFFKF